MLAGVAGVGSQAVKRKPLRPRPRLVPQQPTPEEIAKIDEGLRQLEAVGLIKVDWEAQKDHPGTVHWQLTPLGMKLGAKLRR